jgi:hypothetical protein
MGGDYRIVTHSRTPQLRRKRCAQRNAKALAIARADTVVFMRVHATNSSEAVKRAQCKSNAALSAPKAPFRAYCRYT